ncbi:MAG: HAMP domain-containing sensor histidine kinase [Bacteroidia bacterium]|nr:HAMP domain-containing sensor histidine kinase [Bacteroidia bacterium]
MRNIIVLILFASLIGLGVFQYRLLRISLSLAEIRFDEKMAATLQVLERDLVTENRLTFLLNSAIAADTTFFRLSADSLKDAATYFLGDFLRYNLDNNGIKASFEYQLTDPNNRVLLSSPGFVTGGQRFTYKTALDGYLSAFSHNHYFLNIQITRASEYLLLQLNALTIPSFIFLILIIASSAWLIRNLYWQGNINSVTHDFINNLTHELKTPVFSIALATKLLEAKTSDESVLKLAGMIRKDNDKLKTHIDRVLSLAFLENNKQIIQLQKTDLQPLLEEFVRNWKIKTEMSGGLFTEKIPTEICLVMADESHFTSALDNIMDNALKYSSAPPEITFTAEKKAGKIIITIADKGIGMDEKSVKKIFDKFYRIPEKENLHAVKGFGLGLSYVRHVLKAHKSTIHVQSQPGKGTIFTVEISSTD